MAQKSKKPKQSQADIDRYFSLTDKVFKWAKKIGVEPSDVRVRHMTTKWASCSTKGTMTIGWDVGDLPTELADYVIVHELLHLRIPNHGKLWKSMMTAYLGDWEDLEKRLEGI